MRITNTQEITKEVELVIEDYLVCDKCGNRVNHRPFDTFNFKFEYRTGDIYPETGCGAEIRMDLCPDDAEELVALLAANGYKITKQEWFA